MASARRIEPAKSEPTFKPHKDGVLMTVGARTFLLTLAQVDDHLALYEREGRAAEAEAEFCDRRAADLWNARCAAMDELGATQAAIARATSDPSETRQDAEVAAAMRGAA
jgi:hypothetical protein